MALTTAGWCSVPNRPGGAAWSQPDRFRTVAEVAVMLRVSKMTVYRLVHSGQLPAARIGRSYRIPQQTVSDYLHRAYGTAD